MSSAMYVFLVLICGQAAVIASDNMYYLHSYAVDSWENWTDDFFAHGLVYFAVDEQAGSSFGSVMLEIVKWYDRTCYFQGLVYTDSCANGGGDVWYSDSDEANSTFSFDFYGDLYGTNETGDGKYWGTYTFADVVLDSRAVSVIINGTDNDGMTITICTDLTTTPDDNLELIALGYPKENELVLMNSTGNNTVDWEGSTVSGIFTGEWGTVALLGFQVNPGIIPDKNLTAIPFTEACADGPGVPWYNQFDEAFYPEFVGSDDASSTHTDDWWTGNLFEGTLANEKIKSFVVYDGASELFCFDIDELILDDEDSSTDDN